MAGKRINEIEKSRFFFLEIADVLGFISGTGDHISCPFKNIGGMVAKGGAKNHQITRRCKKYQQDVELTLIQIPIIGLRDKPHVCDNGVKHATRTQHSHDIIINAQHSFANEFSFDKESAENDW